ncbi:ribonuclease H-like domain-containing protein [Rhizophagus irregularis DAOM 181602=DAOM 197198]|nr:ribonuclease H-like domain-containing protein [Rhizophagus irregularis DAOM 181602=DAOM 197198]
MEINEFDENIVSSKRLRRESTGSVHSTITSISSLRTSNNSSVGTLDSFITRPLATRSFTKGEQAIFEKLMIQATVSAGFPLRWVENKEVQELFHFLNPALILPRRKTLGGRILNDESKILENEMTKKLMNDSVGVTLVFDGWTNVLNQNILGSVFITSEGEVIIWKAVDVSSELERWKEVIEKTETMFKEINKMGVNLISVVTDSAPSYAAAWLRLKYVHIMFFPCFTYQMNLFVGEIFKESEKFKQASIKAIKIALYFKSSLHKYFIGQLQTLQKESYGKYVQIAIGNDTRWNSHYECFRTLIKSKGALRTLGSKFESPEQSTSHQSSDNILYLPNNISSILLDETWWQSLSELVKILKPYCIILDILQYDKARLHEVLHGFGYFIKFWKDYDDIELSEKILDRLQTRWQSWEQPLLLLSWLLHPKYKMSKFKDNIPNLNHVYLSKWLIYYYEAWTKTISKSILREYENFRRGIYPFDEQISNQFEDDILKYWGFVVPLAKELGYVAQRIFGICINAASVERLWSKMGFLHTKRRNRLNYEKTLKMSKLRAAISYKHRVNEVKTIQQQKMKENIAEPIVLIIINSNDNTNLENQEKNPINLEIQKENSNTQDDDSDEEGENNEFQVSLNWNNLINTWGQLLLQEKEAELSAVTDLHCDDNIDIDEFLLNRTHPALDNEAKWNIRDIFIDNLDAPFFVNENTSN